jgi:murein DD-endopeptidase MepM/ murein hydrolase activator NlpD
MGSVGDAGAVDPQPHRDEGDRGDTDTFDPGVETGYLRRAPRDRELSPELGAVPFDPGPGRYDDRRARRAAKRQKREHFRARRAAELESSSVATASDEDASVEPEAAEPEAALPIDETLPSIAEPTEIAQPLIHPADALLKESVPLGEPILLERRETLAERLERERIEREREEQERRARVERERAEHERARRERAERLRQQRADKLKREREALRRRTRRPATPKPSAPARARAPKAPAPRGSTGPAPAQASPRARVRPRVEGPAPKRAPSGAGRRQTAARQRGLLWPTAKAGLAVTLVLGLCAALGALLGLPLPAVGSAGDESLAGSAALFGVDAGTPQGLSAGYVFPLEGPHDFGDKLARFGAPRSGHIHEGQDIFGKTGTPEVAVHDGVVVDRGKTTDPDDGGRGNYLAIYSPADNHSFVYMHMLQPAPVQLGDHVHAGEVVGQLGCTGSCEGPHLHFEVRIGKAALGADTKPVDPLPYLQYWPQPTPG